MKPIQEILNRIRWDQRLSQERYKIAYYDRLEKELIIVAFEELHFSADDHFGFYVVDDLGQTYHRVKALYQNDKLIWERKH